MNPGPLDSRQASSARRVPARACARLVLPAAMVLGLAWLVGAELPAADASADLLPGARPTPYPVSPGVPMPASRSNCWAVCEGEITFMTPTPDYLRLDLVEGEGSLPVRVAMTNAADLTWLRHARVRVSGACEARLDLRGKLMPGLLRVPSLAQLELLRPGSEYWSARPLKTRAEVAGTNWSRLQGSPVRLSGRIAAAAAGAWEVVDATGRFTVRPKAAPPLSAGAEIDAVGLLRGAPDHPALDAAFCRLTAQPATAASPAELPVLRSLAEVRALSGTEAARNYPVDVQGLVQYRNRWLVLHDGSAGVCVVGEVETHPGLRFGQRLRLQGVSTNGDFAPLIVASRAEILGEGCLPEPARPALDYLLTGHAEHTWVELEGVVRSLTRSNDTLFVMGRGGQFRVSIADEARRPLPPGVALDSTIRVRGDCGAVLNERGQHIGVDLLVCSVEELEVVEPAPVNPFSAPAVAITNLLQWDPRRDWIHRVRISGVVTHREDLRRCYLQNDTGGILVRTTSEVMLQPGDVVDAVGFPDAPGYSAALDQGVIRKRGSTRLPSPKAASLEELVSGELDCRRVQVRAQVIEQRAQGATQVLLLQAGQRFFRAALPDDQGRLPQIPPGSVVLLTGVCVVSVNASGIPESFELHPNSPADVSVLERPIWWTLQHAIAALGGLLLALLLILAWVVLLRRRVARRTRELHLEIQEHMRTEAELQHKTALLEKEIDERKRMELEVQQTHRQLLLASREAGMAEVAINVLHNVGNVLNSVNVSANLLAEQLRNLEIPHLQKAAELLSAHALDPGFLSAHEKGRRLPEFLQALAAQFALEQAASRKELATLQQHIDQIKDIVAMQQAYSRMAGLTESVKLSDLAEDALRLSAGEAAPHEIKLERDYREDPVLVVDKHKVLQILVHLVRNAQVACDESGRQDKCLTLRITRPDTSGPGRVQFQVIDNGVGIPPENLRRIFAQGFTTRAHGHGYGLHTSANAARELGGSLTAASAGPGHGATFTLELPLKKPSESSN